MFNLILNNLIESARSDGSGCIWDILISPISNLDMAGTARISIDSSGTIYALEFFRTSFDEEGFEIEDSKEHISKKEFLEMLEDSHHVEITSIR